MTGVCWMMILCVCIRMLEGLQEVTMSRFIRLGTSVGAAVALLGAISCGGGAGRTAVVGLGNGGNRIFEAGGIAEALAADLAEHPGTLEVSDELLLEIFESIVTHARAGTRKPR